MVGDGQTYGGYENNQLTASILYSIYYVVASSLDGVTKMNFAITDTPVAPGTMRLPGAPKSDTSFQLRQYNAI